uniref:Protein Jade-1 n=1 Tax=Sarcoptes scabiei TaxID=52283 RepID=A0A834RCY3_SARSC
MKSNDLDQNEFKNFKFCNDFKSFHESIDRSRIYNFESRKKPAELVRKDLISAMKLPDHELLDRNDYIQILDSWKQEWEKGVQVPLNPDALPKSNITTPETYLTEFESGEKKLFAIPKNLIQNQTPIRPVLPAYELDLQDICWLQTVKESDLELEISQNFLEYVIDKFEQESLMLLKKNPNNSQSLEDTTVCDVCKNPDAEDGNEMVFCEICNICVHQACYGILEIPEGDWFCRACENFGAVKKKPLCLLCPNIGGALKPTTKTNKWAHVSCVYWIPEAKFINIDLLEPVDIKSIPNWRWNLVCSLCKVKKGAPIICDAKNCRSSYHVTCAFKHKLKMKIVLTEDKSIVKLKSYCVKHSIDPSFRSKEQSETNKEIDFYTDPKTSNYTKDHSNNSANSVNRNQNETWKQIDFEQIFQEISLQYSSNKNDKNGEICFQNSTITRSTFKQIIDLIFQYWKLKRCANHGNSLIKLTFEEKFQEQVQYHRNQILALRYYLERLRTMTYMICRREKIKCNWIDQQKKIFQATIDFIEELCKFKNHDRSSLNYAIFSSENQRLFSTIINNDCIYSRNHHSVDKNLDNPSSSFLSSQTEFISQRVHLNRRKRNSSANESMANNLIRKIKRFKLTKDLNPYAKFYPSLSRKFQTHNEISTDTNNNQTSNHERFNNQQKCFNDTNDGLEIKIQIESSLIKSKSKTSSPFNRKSSSSSSPLESKSLSTSTSKEEIMEKKTVLEHRQNRPLSLNDQAKKPKRRLICDGSFSPSQKENGSLEFLQNTPTLRNSSEKLKMVNREDPKTDFSKKKIRWVDVVHSNKSSKLINGLSRPSKRLVRNHNGLIELKSFEHLMIESNSLDNRNSSIRSGSNDPTKKKITNTTSSFANNRYPLRKKC